MQMQLQIRLSDAEYLSLKLECQAADDPGSAAGPDVVAAVVTEQKLSVCSMDQLMDVLGQVVDLLGPEAPKVGDNTSSKWDDNARDLFRKGKL